MMIWQSNLTSDSTGQATGQRADLTALSAISALATVSDYAPLPGDSGDGADIDFVRTESRHLVRGGDATLIGRTWWIYTHGTDGNGRATVTVQTIRASSQAAALDAPGNAVSTETRYDADADGIPLLLRGRPVTSTDEDGVTTTYDYALGVYDSSSRAFTPGGAGTALRTVVSRSTAAAPNGIPGKSTQSLTIQDAAHGTTLYTGTLLRSTGATLDWQAHVYDDKNRLRSTLFSDGSSTTNAYFCCRLLWWTERNGATFYRSATTGKDHLQYAIEEVTLSERERDIHYAPPSGYGQSHKATIHCMDSLGRETNTVVGVATQTTPGNYLPTISNNSKRIVDTFYPYGVSDYRYTFDENSVLTLTYVERYVNGRIETRAIYHPTNLNNYVTASQSVSYNHGRTEQFAYSENGVKYESQATEYMPDGRTRQISTTETSDAFATVTNAITTLDFLGRVVCVCTPGFGSWIVTSNAYDGASTRLLFSSVESASGSRTVFHLYDDLGDAIGSIDDSLDGGLAETTHETLAGVVWRVSRNIVFSGDSAMTNTTRIQLTGLSDALRSRNVSISASGTLSETSERFDPATKKLTSISFDDAGLTNIVWSQCGRTTGTWSPSGTSANLLDGMGHAFYTELRYPGTNLSQHVVYRAIDTLGNLWQERQHLRTGVDHDTFFIYDRWNRPISRTDALGNTVETQYDFDDRIVVQSGAIYPTRYVYDTMGRMKELRTTRDGTTWDTTHWHYDPATGLATNKVYADGSSVVYTYTADGKPVRTTWARGDWKENVYTPIGLLAGTTYSDSTPSTAFTYGDFKSLSSASNSVAACHYARNAHGMATNEVIVVGGAATTLTRLPDDRQRVGAISLDGSLHAAYGYDLGNRLGTISNAAFSVRYSTWFTRPVGYSITLSNGNVFTQALQRERSRPEIVSHVVNAFNDVPIGQSVYTHDEISRRTQRLDSSGATTITNTFGYNARSEVTAAFILSNAYTYAYDFIGSHTASTLNSVETTYTANNLNQYSEISVPSVPSVDNLSYDLDGNLLTRGVWSYTWDAENRLVAAFSNSVCVVSNAYDYMSRRVVKVTPTATHVFVYDGWNLIQETVQNQQSTITNHYVWGRDLSGSLQGAGGVGGLLAVKQGNAWYFPLSDANGNITAYVDEQGSIVAEYAYDAFGLTISQSDTMSDAFPHRFSTKYYDSETVLYYYGYRFYSPELHRWVNRDPMEEGGGINLLCFCGNSMLNKIDFLGLKECGIFVRMTHHGSNDLRNYFNELEGLGECTAFFPLTCMVSDYYEKLGGMRLPTMPKKDYWTGLVLNNVPGGSLAGFEAPEHAYEVLRPYLISSAQEMCKNPCKCPAVHVTFSWDKSTIGKYDLDIKPLASRLPYISAVRGPRQAGDLPKKVSANVLDTVWLLDCKTKRWEISTVHEPFFPLR